MHSHMERQGFLVLLMITMVRSDYYFTMPSHNTAVVNIPTEDKSSSVQIVGRMQEAKTVTASGFLEAPGMDVFLGIPYAEVPQRFRHARLRNISSLPSTFNATKRAPGCMAQYNLYNNETSYFSEDCLTLNIWRRIHVNASNSVRVVVIIHGGNYVAGDSNELDWSGSALAYFGNLVVVNFNYRLGVFGFLDLGVEDSPGNQGHMDQALALQWVNKYIKYFGGNPKDVVLMGAGAGSFSITFHLMSGMANGLFHGALIDSAILSTSQAEPQEAHLERARKAAISLNCQSQQPCDGRKNCESLSKDDILKCLRDADAKKLVQIQHTPGVMISNSYVFRPTYNTMWLPEAPNCLINKQKFKTVVPLIVGANSNPGMLPRTEQYFKVRPQLQDASSFLAYNQNIMGEYRARDLVTPSTVAVGRAYNLNSAPSSWREKIYFYGNATTRYIGDGLYDCALINFYKKYSPLVDTFVVYFNRTVVQETYPGEKYDGAYNGLMFYYMVGSQAVRMKGKLEDSEEHINYNFMRHAGIYTAAPHMFASNFPNYRLNRRLTYFGGSSPEGHIDAHPRESVWKNVNKC